MKENKKGLIPLALSEFHTLTGQLSRLLSTKEAPVIIPGEAILGIEGIAAGVSAPGRTILNIVTGPYGMMFGNWLARGGSRVIEVKTSFDEVVTIEAVAAAIQEYKPCALSFVQAEAITGGSNPTEGILNLARQSDLITIIDSVSAIGAEPVLMDEWGIDFAAVGPQKALAGPNGISAVGISKRGWDFLNSNESAPRNSILSLLDLKVPGDSKEAYRVPANIPILEARALIQALEQAEREGLSNMNLRHRLASFAVLAGIKALGLEPWQKDKNGYSPLNTTVRIPQGLTVDLECPQGIVAPGDAELLNRLLRVNHYGTNADQESTEEAVTTLSRLFHKEPEAALRAVRTVWRKEDGQ